MDLEFDYFVRWLKRGGLGSLIKYHIVPVHRGAQRSSARVSYSASRASAAVLFGSLARVMIPLGPAIFSFMYPKWGIA